MNTNTQLATGFGIGHVRYMPGTAASFAAVIVAVPVMSLFSFGWFAILLLAVATAAGGVWVSEAYALQAGTDDPGECVIDEFAGQWLACALAGLGGYMVGEPVGVAGYVLAFAIFRLFDVAKPWPVNKAEELKGGLGIMADDIVAGLIAGGVVFLFIESGFL
jgi:phosphatidylglycerophosphatase A